MDGLAPNESLQSRIGVKCVLKVARVVGCHEDGMKNCGDEARW